MRARRSSLSIRLGRYASPAMRGILLASTAGVIAACDGEDDRRGVFPAAFLSAEDCTKSGAFTEAECLQYASRARTEHLQSAPRFATRARCEDEYDTCEEVVEDASGSSNASGSAWHYQRYFVPQPAGFVVDELVDEAGDALKRPKNRQYSTLYKQRFSGYATSRGTQLYASQVERGGFGVSYYRSSRGGCCG